MDWRGGSGRLEEVLDATSRLLLRQPFTLKVLLIQRSAGPAASLRFLSLRFLHAPQSEVTGMLAYTSQQLLIRRR